MDKTMDRTKIAIATHEYFDKMDDIHWANAPMEEKLETVTFLRECFYGKEASSGRLQRVCAVLKFQ